MTAGQAADFAAAVADQNELLDCFIHREGSSIVFRVKEAVETFSPYGKSRVKTNYPKLAVIRGDWQVSKKRDEISEGLTPEILREIEDLVADLRT
jgi:hypothetical protein